MWHGFDFYMVYIIWIKLNTNYSAGRVLQITGHIWSILGRISQLLCYCYALSPESHCSREETSP